MSGYWQLDLNRHSRDLCRPATCVVAHYLLLLRAYNYFLLLCAYTTTYRCSQQAICAAHAMMDRGEANLMAVVHSSGYPEVQLRSIEVP